MTELRKRTNAEVVQEKFNRYVAPRPGEEVYKWNYLIYRGGRARYLGSTDRPAEREKEHRAELPPTLEYEFRFYPWRGVDTGLLSAWSTHLRLALRGFTVQNGAPANPIAVHET